MRLERARDSSSIPEKPVCELACAREGGRRRGRGKGAAKARAVTRLRERGDEQRDASE